MGFEAVFKYHPRLESGDYDKEEIKELKRKIGDPFEDVPMDKLASAVMSQLARRDIWVVDVDIYEYKKQKVNFRETKGGIVIKNKKFALDQTATLIMEDVQEVVHQDITHRDNGIHIRTSSSHTTGMDDQPPAQNRRPVRWVVLDPDIPNVHKVEKAGLAFKVDQKYPVFSIKPHPKKVGVNVFTMLDDYKREVNVIDEYFVPAQANLQFGDLFEDEKKTANGPKLAYEGLDEMPMPDIRG